MIGETMKKGTIKSFAIALAIFGTALYVGCSNSSDNKAALYWLLIGQDQGHPASGMTETQTAVATSDPITVAETTKTLVLTGVQGKTIYMARTNPSSKKLAKENTRAATKSGISARLVNTPEFSASFSREAEQDPHALIYQNFWNTLKNSSSAAKSLAPVAGSAVKNYSVGDTETFYRLKPENMETVEQKNSSCSFRKAITTFGYVKTTPTITKTQAPLTKP